MKKFNIVKNEYYFVIVAALITIIATTIPYIYAYIAASPDKVYNGLHIFTPGDMHVYLSYLEQVKQGNYLFKNLFTSETTLPVFNIFWLILGLFGKLFNLNNIITFHLFRILLVPICLISIYFLISYFFKSKIIRKITFVFLLLSSGVGALASVLIPSYISNDTLLYWPMDLWVPEYNLFLTLYHSPHLIASLTLIVLIFLFFLLAIEENKTRYSLLAGISGLLLIQFHPFHLPTIFLVPGFYLLIKFIQQKKIGWQEVKHLLILLILTSPSVLYYAWLMFFDWSTAIKASQNYCYTPTFFTTLISYGGLIFFGAIMISIYLYKSIIKKIKADKIQQYIPDSKFLFIIIWAIVQFSLIFAPVKFQRRLTEGLQIPLVFLSIIAILIFREFLKTKFKHLKLHKLFFNKYFLAIVFILGFALSNLIIIAKDINYFKTNYELFYIDKQQLKSYQWLKNNSSNDDIILSSLPNGNFIPGIAGRKVYFGHVNVETLYYDEKLANLNWFFKYNINDEEKIKFLQKNSIDYIYYSKYEKELGKFNPDQKDYFKPVYSDSFSTIYKTEGI